MYITNVSNLNQNFGKLVPLKEYKGVVLKLTKKEKEQITNLTLKKSDLLHELACFKASYKPAITLCPPGA